MGFFTKLIYATLVSKEVREAIKIDEIKKLNYTLDKIQKGKK
tara:strand:+ start:923 stop:1048 length:126 start_codon:yes stop_codon:yes gene_type:complete